MWAPVIAVLVAVLLMLSGVALAAPITVIDDAGPDDEPGQKDLNQLTVDFDSVTADIVVTWNWDVTSVSGANTGDACSLFDTDKTGMPIFRCVSFGIMNKAI